MTRQSYIISTVAIITVVVFFSLPSEALYMIPIKKWASRVKIGLEQRTEADPKFVMKSIEEVILAAGTQLTAEFERRGVQRIVPEIDFVVAGVLTAVYGKYSSMWRVAPTRSSQQNSKKAIAEPMIGSMKVPTNAFQPFLLDGKTRPSVQQRLASLVTPMMPLFQAGVAASLVGYGMTAAMIFVRSVFLPSYVPATQKVNIFSACLYTGVFMATVSNIRYQLLQGIIEPSVELHLGRFSLISNIVIFGLRVANGLLGSMLAIAGMQLLGLQKLR